MQIVSYETNSSGRKGQAMNVQTPSRFDRHVATGSGITPGYMSGFGNGFETEALPGALAGRPQLAAEMPLRALCRAALGLALHGAAHRQRALLALPHPPDRHALGRVPEGRHRPVAHRARARGRLPIAPYRWDPIADPVRAALLPRRHAHDDDGGRCRHAGRHGRASLFRHPLDGGRVFLQLPTARCCSSPQQGELRLWTEFGIIDIEPGEIAVIPRGVKIRVELLGRAGARLSLRELRRRPHAARARADRRQLPGQPARFPDALRRLRGPRGAVEDVREMGRQPLGLRPRPLAARRRRLARQLRALQIRPAQIFAGRPDPLRPCRSVDLHGPDLALARRPARRISTS